MTTVIGTVVFPILIPLTFLVLYQWLLAASSFFYRAPSIMQGSTPTRFLLIVPAHNEETGIATTLESLNRLDYQRESFQILVIADRCTDRTAAVARAKSALCFERYDGRPGKGAAIAWGIQEANSKGLTFGAVVIVDADTLADRQLLSAFNSGLKVGHQVQQGYNYISNPWASPFTRIIAVTGILRNGRYYAGKMVLGLQAMLTGTGMCLSSEVLARCGWTAFSVGEDWEFSVELLSRGEDIYFNASAKTFAKESRNIQEASHQRLRWASGRYAIMSKSWALTRQGIRTRAFSFIDSAVTLIAPNYSSQASLALLCLAGSWMTAADPSWGFLLYWAVALLAAIAGYYMLGVLSTDSPFKAMTGLLLVPVFLPWRLTIEVLGMLGYGRRTWGRMARAGGTSQQTNR